MPSKSRKSSSKIRNLKLTLEYDGSSFFGFQLQKRKPTIQSALEKALSQFFNRPMKISAASGRTDTGVHAQGQVVNFKTDSGRTLFQIQKGLNALLPERIAVRKIEEVPLDFHARFAAQAKTYEYLVWNSPFRSPLLRNRVFHYPYPLDLAAMRRAIRGLVGKHDFRVFQATGSNARSSIRTIRRFILTQKGSLLCFRVEADGFLYHMMRNLVGALLEVGRGKLDPRKLGASTRYSPAPPQGLTLLTVKYPLRNVD